MAAPTLTAAAPRFRDKVVVVIGGNSGIGLRSAERFAAEGAIVAITGRNPATIETASVAIGAGTLGAAVDVRDHDGTAAFLDTVAARYGRIDVLFVNAGVGWFSDVRQIAREDWSRVLDINLTGAFFAARHALGAMTRGGAILFTSSTGSRVAVPGNVAYAASKAGLRAAARIMAHELAPDGIRVNVLSPGGVDTPIMQREQGVPAERMAEIGEAFMASVPLGRIGTPDDIAAAALFLCSDEASYITGVDLFVDGGMATP